MSGPPRAPNRGQERARPRPRGRRRRAVGDVGAPVGDVDDIGHARPPVATVPLKCRGRLTTRTAASSARPPGFTGGSGRARSPGRPPRGRSDCPFSRIAKADRVLCRWMHSGAFPNDVGPRGRNPAGFWPAGADRACASIHPLMHIACGRGRGGGRNRQRIRLIPLRQVPPGAPCRTSSIMNSRGRLRNCRLSDAGRWRGGAGRKAGRRRHTAREEPPGRKRAPIRPGTSLPRERAAAGPPAPPRGGARRVPTGEPAAGAGAAGFNPAGRNRAGSAAVIGRGAGPRRGRKGAVGVTPRGRAAPEDDSGRPGEPFPRPAADDREAAAPFGIPTGPAAVLPVH